MNAYAVKCKIANLGQVNAFCREARDTTAPKQLAQS